MRRIRKPTEPHRDRLAPLTVGRDRDAFSWHFVHRDAASARAPTFAPTGLNSTSNPCRDRFLTALESRRLKGGGRRLGGTVARSPVGAFCAYTRRRARAARRATSRLQRRGAMPVSPALATRRILVAALFFPAACAVAGRATARRSRTSTRLRMAASQTPPRGTWPSLQTARSLYLAYSFKSESAEGQGGRFSRCQARRVV